MYKQNKISQKIKLKISNAMGSREENYADKCLHVNADYKIIKKSCTLFKKNK